MKKILLIAFILIVFTALLGGCGSSPATATPDTTPSVAPTEPLDTAPPEPSTSPTQDENPATKAKTYKDMTYYLDIKDSVAVEYDEDPPLHIKKTDGGSDDKELGVRGFNFDIVGDFIYVDSLDPDLDGNGIRTWSTTRMKPDGSDKKRLEYCNMSARLTKDDEQKFYFTTAGDSAIYVSDFACENVTTLMIDLPDKSDIDKKLGNEKALQIDISGVKDGLVTFVATYSSEEGIELYNGTYTVTQDGKTVKKLKGNYIDNSQEREVD